MSVWTRVCGVIRIDTFEHDLNFEDIFGRESNYTLDQWINEPEKVNTAFKDYEEHPDRYLPMGSEGSLHMSVWENPDRGDANCYTVSIFGDLRDWDDPEIIMAWFQSKLIDLKELGVGIPNAMIEADNGVEYYFWSAREKFFENEIQKHTE